MDFGPLAARQSMTVKGISRMDVLLLIWRYFATVTLTGESGNLWLFTLPPDLVDSTYKLGVFIAGLLFP